MTPLSLMTPLKRARIDRGWSQEKIAKLTGLPQPTISRAERSGSATTEVALKIARALGSSVEELFGVVETPAEVVIEREGFDQTADGAS